MTNRFRSFHVMPGDRNGSRSALVPSSVLTAEPVTVVPLLLADCSRTVGERWISLALLEAKVELFLRDSHVAEGLEARTTILDACDRGLIRWSSDPKLTGRRGRHGYFVLVDPSSSAPASIPVDARQLILDDLISD
jgi:hypothetical protein